MIETEITLYAKVANFEYFKNPLERHTQCALKSPKGSCRVRKTQRAEHVSYELTTKEKSSGSDKVARNNENNFIIDENTYTHFRSICEQEMIKDRFLVPVKKVTLSCDGRIDEIDLFAFGLKDKLNYEIDLFVTQAGGYDNWCKIDLEIDALLPALTKLYGDSDVKIIIQLSKLGLFESEVIDDKDNRGSSLVSVSDLYKRWLRKIK